MVSYISAGPLQLICLAPNPNNISTAPVVIELLA